MICLKRPSRLSEEKKELDNETDREALAAVAEKKEENHKFPVSYYSSIPFKYIHDDKMKFNEEIDTYNAFLSFMPVAGPCHLCPPWMLLQSSQN